VFGCRFAYVPPAPVVAAAAKHLDAISFNCYDTDPRRAIDAYSVFGKPLVIGEFAFRGDDSGLPNTRGAGPRVKTQADRAAAFSRYATWALSKPNLVGYHWFEHADEPKEGRFDGENSNYGLVNLRDEPYQTLTEAMGRLNAQAELLHGKP
jgi:agarase